MTPVFSDLICSCSDHTVRWLWTTRHGSAWCNPGCPAVHLSGGHGTSHLSHSDGERRLEKNLWNQHVPKLCKLKIQKFSLEQRQVQEVEKRFLAIQTHSCPRPKIITKYAAILTDIEICLSNTSYNYRSDFHESCEYSWLPEIKSYFCTFPFLSRNLIVMGRFLLYRGRIF